jgi:hypothetical protein
MDWQPIETYPRNKTVLLFTDTGYTAIGYQYADFVWRESNDDRILSIPTHWMPLPAPPKS